MAIEINDIILLNNEDNLFSLNNDKTITLNTNVPGIYTVDFTIRYNVVGTGCNEVLYSNIGRITAEVKPNCDFNIIITET